jgi:FdhD protein
MGMVMGETQKITGNHTNTVSVNCSTPSNSSASSVSQCTVLRDGKQSDDFVVVEEPLEIRISHGPLNNRSRSVFVTTMRTPGYDAELAIGSLLSERVIQSFEDVIEIKREDENSCLVFLHPDCDFQPQQLKRTGFANSSCGMCGRHIVDQLLQAHERIDSHWQISAELVSRMPEIAMKKQLIFTQTGGSHAAGLFSQAGELVNVFEDVGRHNAVDKLLGWAWREGLEQSKQKLGIEKPLLQFEKSRQLRWPLHEHALFVSSRASFEIVQKATMANIPIVVAVGAPTSLAVQLAQEVGMSLIGFVRDSRFNVYANPERLK